MAISMCIRCAELITTLFMDPVRASPLTAIVTKNIMDMRRVLLRNPDRRRCFLVNLELAVNHSLEKVNGPAHGLLALAEAINCRLEISDHENDVTIVCDDAGRGISLLSKDLPLLRWNLRDFATRSILAGLVARVAPDADGHSERKDLVGITSVVDRHATLALTIRPCDCGVDTQSSEGQCNEELDAKEVVPIRDPMNKDSQRSLHSPP